MATKTPWGEPFEFCGTHACRIFVCMHACTHDVLDHSHVTHSHTAMMAIRVLLDHGVPEENIILVSLIVAPEGEGRET